VPSNVPTSYPTSQPTSSSIQFSQVFFQDQKPADSVVTAWLNFRAALNSTGFNSFKFESSLGGVVSCNDASIAGQLAKCLYSGTYCSTPCGSLVWSVCNNVLIPGVEFVGAATSACTKCVTSGHTLRPGIGSPYWGGGGSGPLGGISKFLF
jgi:hypothetical protein